MSSSSSVLFSSDKIRKFHKLDEKVKRVRDRVAMKAIMRTSLQLKRRYATYANCQTLFSIAPLLTSTQNISIKVSFHGSAIL